VAQRRRRVFVVGHLGDWQRAAQVLFERESVRRDSPPSREARQGVAAGVAQCFAGSRQSDVAATLETTAHDYSRADGFNMVAQVFKVRGGVEREDGSRGSTNIGKQAGKGYLGSEERAFTLAAAQDQFVAQPVAFHNRQDPDVSGDITHPLGAKDNGMAVAQPVATAMQVRRLTPVECERLQGFPDGYTNIPWRKSPEAPDGPRYKALGNSMAVPCMAWIGKRIAEVDRGD
jgi:DNA (cytosine-5)-methyltransferase 1